MYDGTVGCHRDTTGTSRKPMATDEHRLMRDQLGCPQEPLGNSLVRFARSQGVEAQAAATNSWGFSGGSAGIWLACLRREGIPHADIYFLPANEHCRAASNIRSTLW